MDRPTGSLAASPPGAPPLLEASRRFNLPFTRPDGGNAFEPMPGGSVPLYTDGRWVLKFFPPGGERFALAEWTALHHLHGRVPFEVPAPLEWIEIEGWSVVGMSLLGGIPARAIWSRLRFDQRLDLSRQLGRALRSLHELAPPESSALCAPGGDFETYLRERLTLFAETPGRLGHDRAWVDRAGEALSRFLEARDGQPNRPGVLLHTEIMPEHVLVRCENDRPILIGLVDFEPSMVGDPLYEFASVGWFWAEGNLELLQAVLTGYDENREHATCIERSDLMAHTLAHRYFHRERWLDRLEPSCRDQSLAELTRYVFGSGARDTETA